MNYGEKRDYRRIDIYTKDPLTEKFRYHGTTTWARTLRIAKERIMETTGYDRRAVLVTYSDNRSRR